MTTIARDDLIALNSASLAAHTLAARHRDIAGHAMQSAVEAPNPSRELHLEEAERHGLKAWAAELEARHLGNEFLRGVDAQDLVGAEQ